MLIYAALTMTGVLYRSRGNRMYAYVYNGLARNTEVTNVQPPSIGTYYYR